jgi:hypothetical protein
VKKSGVLAKIGNQRDAQVLEVVMAGELHREVLSPLAGQVVIPRCGEW